MAFFKNHSLGRVYGFLQLLFWMIMLPYTIIAIPMDLYYETTSTPPPSWLASFYADSTRWEDGVVFISTFIMFLGAWGLIWIGNHELHPIHIKRKNIDRRTIVKNFSKEKFLKKIIQDSREEYAKRNQKKK